MMVPNPKLCLTLLVLFGASISGCLVFNEPESEEEEPAVDPFSIPRIAPATPLMLNETVEGKVWYEFGQETKDCVLVGDDGSYHSPPRVAFVQYDKYDLQQQIVEQVDPDSTSFHFNFTLIGEAPHLVFLNAYVCTDMNHFSGVHNIIDGDRLAPDRDQWRQLKKRAVHYGNMTVPQLETAGTGSWTPPKNFYIFNGAFFRYEWEGNAWGTFNMYDPDGSLRTWDNYSVFGFDGGGEMMSRGPPGAYPLELELSGLARTDTRWAYYISFTEFTEPICQYGFEWDFLCT